MRVRSHREGLTFVELAVTLGITIMMLSIFLGLNSGGRQYVSLLAEKAKIGQMVLRAKSLAVLTGREPSPPPFFCGYGIRFDYAAQSYEVFKYLVDDNDTCTAANLTGVSPADSGYQAVNALSFTVNSDLNLVPGALAAVETIGTILFIPPDPVTMLWDDGGGRIFQGSIVLETKRTGTQGKVDLNSGGQISY
jgi:hypothetical protein